MDWLPSAQVATFFSSLLLTFVFFYLYFQEHEYYLLIWAIGWGAYSLNFALFFALLFIQVEFLFILVSILVQILYLLNAILILYGTYLLIERPWNSIWVVIGLFPAIWAVVFIFQGAFYSLYAHPTYVYVVILYIMAGINVLKLENISLLIKRIAGFGLIFWAVHQVDFLFLSRIEWFAPWGFLLSSILEFAVAIAVILIFFERNRHQLQRREQELAVLNAELESKVVERTKQLEDVLHEMESFSYSVSHDLRAPVRAIIGFSEILENEYAAELPQDAQLYLERITNNGVRMEALIQDLLMLSRIGRQGLDWQTVNLSEIAQSAFDDLKQSFIGTAQVNFIAQPTKDVLADKNLMRLLFDNLISNALKFSRNNECIEIEFGSTDAPCGCEYYLKDNGVGFPMEHQDKLFAVFSAAARP